MKNKTKRVLWGFFSLDYKAMESYLEEMAEKGWMPVKIGRYLAKFKSIEPQKLKFYVDVFKEGGPLTPEKTEESEAYRKLCQESGWTFITSQDYLQFFYADEDSQPTPIQIDEEIEQKIVENTLLRNELRDLFIFLALVVFMMVRNIPLSYSILLTFTGLMLIFLFPLLCIFSIVPAVYSIIWMIKARRNIKNDLTIEKPTLKSARRRIIVFYGSTWIITIFLVLSFIADAFFMPEVTALMLIGPGAGALLGSSIRYLIKKNKIKKEDGALYLIIGLIAIVIFIQVAGTKILEESENFYIVNSVPEDYPIITLGEISKTNDDNVIREFKLGMSPIVPKHYTYKESEDVNGDYRRISIKYYETVNSNFAEILFTGIIDELERGMKWRGMTIFSNNIITDDDMKKLWDVDNIALIEERDQIIMQKGNIVLHIVNYYGVMDFNDRQTQELIISRFFPDSLVE